MDGTIICSVDYSQEYLEIVQFSRLATIRHFRNSDCFLCHYNLLLQSFWKDIHLFFLPNWVSFISIDKKFSAEQKFAIATFYWSENGHASYHTRGGWHFSKVGKKFWKINFSPKNAYLRNKHELEKVIEFRPLLFFNFRGVQVLQLFPIPACFWDMRFWG